jgi:histone-lysine N-methyltransferase SETMAR
MALKPIVQYLSLKGLNATEIHADMEATLGRNVIGYSTITLYLRETLFCSSNQDEPSSDIPIGLDESDLAILSSLDENPFASVRQLSRLTHLPRMTVYNRLTQTLGFTARHLRWVPHILSGIQKETRVELSKQLLKVLEVQEDRAWHDIITLDESWFYLTTEHERIWLPEGANVPDREQPTVQTKKIMLTIAWNPHGFHVIKVLPKGRKFNAEYYAFEILEPLSRWHKAAFKKSKRKLIIHADIARSHTAQRCIQFMKDNKMKKAPHPPYLPDLAPSDFYLFGYIKQCLAGLSFNSGDELYNAVRGVLEHIEKTTLQSVFFEWIIRLRRCVASNGNYID